MSTYAVSMDCPHATVPSVLWRVLVFDNIAKTGAEVPAPNLWVPDLSTWTLDTLRMVLHELAAYLPAHDSATVTIDAKTNRACGRPRKHATPRPPKLSERVTIAVSARGWTAEAWAWRNEIVDKDGKWLGRGPGEWSEPMQAALLDLAEKSPFSLETVRVVDCADPFDLNLRYPARRDVIRGIEASSDRASVIVRRISDVLQKLAAISPESLTTIEQTVERLGRQLDLEDED